MAEILYQLNKGTGGDSEGANLRNWIANQTLNTIRIEDSGKATLVNASNLFYNKQSLTNITLNTINTSNVTNIAYLFYNCRNLVNISNFNIINSVNALYAFTFCNKLTDAPNLDYSNCTNIVGMFGACINLINIPNINSINTTNTSYLFQGCNKLVNAPSMITNKVISTLYMFDGCTNLKNVPSYNTINTVNMSSMFSNCTNLINIPNINTSNVTNISRIFYRCSNLTGSINYDISNVSNISEAFFIPSHYAPISFGSLNCYSIQNVYNAFLCYINSIGTLDNLGVGFNLTTNHASETLNIYSLRTSALATTALSGLANLVALGKNRQQITMQSEVLSGMSSVVKTEIANKGWYLIGSGNACLLGDTYIKTNSGKVKIKDIVEDDLVYTYNINTKETKLSKVIKLCNHKQHQLFNIITNNSIITCTPDHPFYIINKGKTLARYINIGDKLLNSSNEEIEIININIQNDVEELVYELNTENGDTYLVNDEEIVVYQENLKDIIKE